ncbi:MAG: STAS domain-containing protein [bacterium]
MHDREREGNQVVVLSLRGYVSVSEVERLREQLSEILTRGCTNVLLDLSRVESMDSCGLGAIVRVRRSLKMRGGNFGVFGLNRRMQKLFETTRLSEIVRVFGSGEEGIKSIGDREKRPFWEKPSPFLVDLSALRKE